MFLLYKIGDSSSSNQKDVFPLGYVTKETGLQDYADYLIRVYNYTIKGTMRHSINMLNADNKEETLAIKQLVNLDQDHVKKENMDSKKKKQILIKDSEQLDAIIAHLNNNNLYFKDKKNIDINDYRLHAAKSDVNATKIIDKEREEKVQ